MRPGVQGQTRLPLPRRLRYRKRHLATLFAIHTATSKVTSAVNLRKTKRSDFRYAFVDRITEDSNIVRSNARVHALR